MGFSRQEYRSGLPFPSPGDLRHSGIKPQSPTLRVGSLLTEPPGKPRKEGCFFPKLGTLMPVISENQIFTDRLSRYWVASKVMLKILQARLQQHVNRELPDVQAGFRKGQGTRDQIANIRWIIEKAREFQKTSISALLTMPKPLTVWITINCGKFLKEMGIPDHLTCLLRNLYAGQEATVRTGHGTDWFQIGK